MRPEGPNSLGTKRTCQDGRLGELDGSFQLPLHLLSLFKCQMGKGLQSAHIPTAPQTFSGYKFSRTTSSFPTNVATAC